MLTTCDLEERFLEDFGNALYSIALLALSAVKPSRAAYPAPSICSHSAYLLWSFSRRLELRAAG